MKNKRLFYLTFLAFIALFNNSAYSQLRILVQPSDESVTKAVKLTSKQALGNAEFSQAYSKSPALRYYTNFIANSLNKQDARFNAESRETTTTNFNYFDLLVVFDIRLEELNPPTKTPVTFVGTYAYIDIKSIEMLKYETIANVSVRITYSDKLNMQPSEVLNENFNSNFESLSTKIRSNYGLVSFPPLQLGRIGLLDKKANAYVRESYYLFPNSEKSLNEDKYKVKTGEIDLAISYFDKIYVGKYTGEYAQIKINETINGETKKQSFDWPHGKGKFTAIGLNMEGEWFEGMLNGQATLVKNVLYKDDIDYEYNGTFLRNERSGTGKFKHNNMQYEGEWLRDSMNGKGTLTYRRYLYNGEFVNNTRNGNGILIDGYRQQGNEESIFRGIWVNDFVNGPGSLINLKNEDTTKGTFEGCRLLFTGNKKDERLNYTYSGGYVKSLFSGEGELNMKNGDYYKGVFNNGTFVSGQVKMQHEDKSVYEGLMADSKKNGKGKYTNAAGLVYDGLFTNDKFTGKGKYVYPNGEYEGDIVLDVPQGQGSFKFSFPTNVEGVTGDSSYSGGLLNGVPHGKGTLTIQNGAREPFSTSYSGDFVNGKKEGLGKAENQFSGETEVYEGEWKNDLRQGKGKLISSSEYGGSTTVGTWTNNILSGYAEETGQYTDPMTLKLETSTYKGMYSENVKEGQGTETSSDGTYTGNFSGGSKNGTGKMVYKDGRIYDGQWKDGSPHGQGTMTLANKTIQTGKFIYGEFQKPFVCQQVTIGTQVWMAENLKVTKFRNGDEIPEARTIQEWTRAGANKEAAFCYYNNDPSTAAQHGVLYNYYAVTDSRGLAPEGWKIPSHIHTETLREYLSSDIMAMQNKITELQNNGISTSAAQEELNKVFSTSQYLPSLTYNYLPNFNKGAKFFLSPTKAPGATYKSRDEYGDFKSSEWQASYWTSSYKGNDGYIMAFDKHGMLNSKDNALPERGWLSGHWLFYEDATLAKQSGLAVRCIKE